MYTEEQLNDFKELFSLFDKKGSGQVDVSVIGDLLRAIGENPTEAQVRAITANLPGGGKSGVTFDMFVDILAKPDTFKLQATMEEFLQGFHVFDKDQTGYISTGELRYVLTSLGEKLSDADVDELLKYVEQTKDGTVRYEDFVRAIISG
ncbi:hypothetical protein BCR44DRAFT_80296 [Catenaria anguillulae PL171]|uniref:EF-hand domain-containing protein n=1 Tax=Catenaria anguillulae PL171 TaxID=765915 RepID=A0A1Y2HN50_9FUNG|nr:hypothetical protein BCR44DRAFT_80296 [Catenaria anguillulae PL171]